MPTMERLYKSKPYSKIAEVLFNAHRPLAPHEFGTVFVYSHDTPRRLLGNGRQFMNMTEVSIKRRLCEMVEKGFAARRFEMKKPISKKDIKINPARREILVRGEAVHLAPKQFDSVLALSADDRTMSREELSGGDLDVTRLVDQHICRIRKVLGREAITTVSKSGYRWF